MKKKNIIIWLLIALYTLIFIFSREYPFFWDSILQVSKEGHKFYLTDFFSHSLPEQYTKELSYSSFFFPMMGFVTSVLWKLLGYKLWVTHFVGFLCGLGLIYNTWKIANRIFPKNFSAWVTLILLIEPTILAQLVVSSVDIIIYMIIRCVT
ncbi:MAG: hypothetical protein QM751_03255 [Paludibacteraceae bacterium]